MDFTSDFFSVGEIFDFWPAPICHLPLLAGVFFLNNMEGQKLWIAALNNFKSQLSSSTYKTWFSRSFAMDLKNQNGTTVLIVGVPSSFIKEQLEKRYLTIILKELKGMGCDDVFFVVSSKADIKVSSDEPLFSGFAHNVFGLGKAKGLNPYHTFDNYVVGFSNNLAYLAATQVAKEPGKTYNPLLVYGPSGVGKTHLLQAIGNEIVATSKDAKVIYVSAEKFTNEYIESLRNKTQESFREKYRKADVLLVDDIQFLSGKEGTQDEFFFTFNELFLCGKQIICAADRHPREMGKVKERLISRFLGGMAADISLPDLEMKMAIIKAKCKEKSVDLTGEMVAFIAQSCPGGARELEGSLVSVLAQVKLGGGNVGIEDIKLGYQQSRPVVNVTPGKIIDAVCKYYKVKTTDICGISRKASLVKARQTLMYLLRKELDLPLTQIGQLLGGRDHSTVIHGLDKVARLQKEQGKTDEILRIESLIFAVS